MDVPYVLLPYCHAPGAESLFSLTILSDDRDDDGELDFGFAPVRPPPSDWYTGRIVGPWADATGGAPLQLPLRFGSAPAAAQLYAFVETLGVSADMRGEAGLQSAPSYPPVGLHVVGAETHTAGPDARDGVWTHATLGGESTLQVVPFVADGHAAAAAAYQFAVTLYSDAPFEFGGEGGGAARAAAAPPPCPDWVCPGNKYCEGADKCPFHKVLEKMERVGAIMDQRIAFLDEVLA
jgi:hypothetical protein